MEVSIAIKKRRGVRKFRSKPISSEMIEKLSDALIWAPSAGNLQSRKFYFVFNEEVRKKLAVAANRQQPLWDVPLVVVCCVNEKSADKYGERGKKLFAVCDVAASIENMMLQAVELGLATLWMGAFDEDVVKEIVGLSENVRPVALVPVGYAAEDPDPPARLAKEEIIIRIN
jgi:nitroreductase